MNHMHTPDSIVGCPSCGASLNASTTPWCHCVTKRPNLVCASCGNCGCKIADRIMLRFWNDTPASLHERRIAEQNARKAAAASRVGGGGDILVIDDDEEIRLITSFMLTQMGYRVTVASQPDEVLNAVDRHPPRLVITDALMPKMDGRELCRQIKSLDLGVKVVIMTSLYTAPHYKYEAYKQFHADGYLPKPIDFEELHQMLERLCPLSTRAAVTAVHA